MNNDIKELRLKVEELEFLVKHPTKFINGEEVKFYDKKIVILNEKGVVMVSSPISICNHYFPSNWHRIYYATIPTDNFEKPLNVFEVSETECVKI